MFKLFNLFGDKFIGQREASRKDISDSVTYLGWKRGNLYLVKKYERTGDYPNQYEEITFVAMGHINWEDRATAVYEEVDHGDKGFI